MYFLAYNNTIIDLVDINKTTHTQKHIHFAEVLIEGPCRPARYSNTSCQTAAMLEYDVTTAGATRSGVC